MKNTKTQKLILCGLFTALIAVGAFIRIPIPVVPFTLQFLFIILAVPGDIVLCIVGSKFLNYLYAMVPYIIDEHELVQVLSTMKKWFCR